MSTLPATKQFEAFYRPLNINIQISYCVVPKISVVVQFYFWFNFYFLLFLGMVMYDNEFKTKEKKN